MDVTFKTGFTDKEIDAATSQFLKWWRKNLEVKNKGYQHLTDDIFGLPYTSSGECAGLWNTNAENSYIFDVNYHFIALFITAKNEVMVALKDYNGNIKYIYIGEAE